MAEPRTKKLKEEEKKKSKFVDEREWLYNLNLLADFITKEKRKGETEKKCVFWYMSHDHYKITLINKKL